MWEQSLLTSLAGTIMCRRAIGRWGTKRNKVKSQFFYFFKFLPFYKITFAFSNRGIKFFVTFVILVFGVFFVLLYLFSFFCYQQPHEWFEILPGQPLLHQLCFRSTGSSVKLKIFNVGHTIKPFFFQRWHNKWHYSDLFIGVINEGGNYHMKNLSYYY